MRAIGAGRARSRMLGAVLTLALAVGLAGCTVPVRGADGSPPAASIPSVSSVLVALGSGSPTGTVVVTVPGLAGAAGAGQGTPSGGTPTGGVGGTSTDGTASEANPTNAAPASGANPGSGASSGPGPGATPSGTSAVLVTPTTTTATLRTGSSEPTTPGSGLAAPTTAAVPDPAGGSTASTAARPTATTATLPTAQDPPASGSGSRSVAASTVAVSVANCAKCQVLATRAGVRAGFSAALIAPPRGERR